LTPPSIGPKWIFYLYHVIYNTYSFWLHHRQLTLSATFPSLIMLTFRLAMSTMFYVPFTILSLLVLMVFRAIFCINFDQFLQNPCGYCLGVQFTQVSTRLPLNLVKLDQYWSLVILRMSKNIVQFYLTHPNYLKHLFLQRERKFSI